MVQCNVDIANTTLHIAHRAKTRHHPHVLDVTYAVFYVLVHNTIVKPQHC